MIKNMMFIFAMCFCFDALANEEARDTSLFEATVYTGIPALTLAMGSFVYEIEVDKATRYRDMPSNFRRGFTHLPVWDNNPWYVNYVGHPVCGAEYYLLARNRGYGGFGSFIYSTALSITWEYGIESWIGARPSIQDLVFTSTIGSILGEIRYFAKNKLKKKDDTFSKVMVVILDPIDAIYVVLEN